ncbi:hypothetical protein HETIRDRAFT_419286 [Heterobasidion irregulare TC 32-1]|uniref:Uncharacterized protein n=1 Tax=Heterobasidion irregulare (strain TC 32-1) TaxID=747525 RepID=W4K2M1_HETIT|nr:uncharacterized protein HETIRDRAFT_419286 [Heterobasidion irregulare TC 32-1]ETW79600.1 hypothetical protein HETIRDRAFT_419286 [Heterobasidion irregulare TC 32-1]
MGTDTGTDTQIISYHIISISLSSDPHIRACGIYFSPVDLLSHRHCVSLAVHSVVYLYLF